MYNETFNPNSRIKDKKDIHETIKSIMELPFKEWMAHFPKEYKYTELILEHSVIPEAILPLPFGGDSGPLIRNFSTNKAYEYLLSEENSWMAEEWRKDKPHKKETPQTPFQRLSNTADNIPDIDFCFEKENSWKCNWRDLEAKNPYFSYGASILMCFHYFTKPLLRVVNYSEPVAEEPLKVDSLLFPLLFNITVGDYCKATDNDWLLYGNPGLVVPGLNAGVYAALKPQVNADETLMLNPAETFMENFLRIQNQLRDNPSSTHWSSTANSYWYPNSEHDARKIIASYVESLCYSVNHYWTIFEMNERKRRYEESQIKTYTR